MKYASVVAVPLPALPAIAADACGTVREKLEANPNDPGIRAIAAYWKDECLLQMPKLGATQPDEANLARFGRPATKIAAVALDQK